MSLALRQKILTIAVVTSLALGFTIVVALAFGAPLLVAIIVGVLMGLAISCIEEFYVQGRPGAWMRRIRPISAIPIYAFAICIVFLMVQHFAYFVTGRLANLTSAYQRYHLTIPILFVISSLIILALRVVGFIGARNLVNLLIGRYMRPIIERKIMLFLDLKGSTAAVEDLGPVKAKAYIGKFLFDISRPVTDNGGDIYLFTGDGLVAIWDWDYAIAGNNIVTAVDAINVAIDREASAYQNEFGRVPEFRIGVHGGEVVISEQGDTKRAIGVYGDAINIAARMEQTAKKIGVDCVFSADIVEHLPVVEKGFEPQDQVTVQGISEPVRIYSYSAIV